KSRLPMVVDVRSITSGIEQLRRVIANGTRTVERSKPPTISAPSNRNPFGSMHRIASGSTHSHRITAARTSRSLLHSSACAGSLLGSAGFELGPAAAKPLPGAGFAPTNLSSASSALVRLANLLRATSTRRTSAGVAHHARCTPQPSVSANTNNVPTVILVL